VLLVDDDENLRDVLDETLSQRGLQVLSAADGLSALEIIANRRVDLVLLDVEVSGNSGLGLLSALREQREALPIIAMIGHRAHGDAAEALRRGARSCLRKPFDLARLFQEVELALAVPHVE